MILHKRGAMESCRIIRDCKKVLLRIDARYFCCNSLCKASVNEISECCMCIETDCFIPLNSRIELLIPVKKNVLSVPSRVKGHLRTENKHDVMSIEVLKPSRQYVDFVNSINVDA
jgi:hypothetical protein